MQKRPDPKTGPSEEEEIVDLSLCDSRLNRNFRLVNPKLAKQSNCFRPEPQQKCQQSNPEHHPADLGELAVRAQSVHEHANKTDQKGNDDGHVRLRWARPAA